MMPERASVPTVASQASRACFHEPPPGTDPMRPCRLLVLALSGLAALLPAAEPDPRAARRIEALTKLLPEYEKAADECEKALARFADSRDENVRAAVDGARLRIECVRSLR